MNQQVLLRRRPTGVPVKSDFEIVDARVPAMNEGEVLRRTIYLSIDPYMRARMSEVPSYAPPVALGAVMVGQTVSEVIESRNSRFRSGDIVTAMDGWQQYAVSNGDDLRILDPEVVPVSTALGALGMPGLAAYVGLLDIGQPKSNETVVISAAAGAVGSVAGQIALLKGCRVVGIVGSQEKCDFVTGELGFSAAVNHKSRDFNSKLRGACPDGIDVYFDNVGGPVLSSVLRLINRGARIPMCGMISQYNATETQPGPNVTALMTYRARIQGFVVSDHLDRFDAFVDECANWIRDGRMRCRENIVEGLENAPQALIGLFEGTNIGKTLVQVSPRILERRLVRMPAAAGASDAATASSASSSGAWTGILRALEDRENRESAVAQSPVDSSAWALDRRGAIAVLTFRRPPTNLLSILSTASLLERLREVERDPSVSVVVVTGGIQDYFVAHADLEDLTDRGSGHVDPYVWHKVTAILESMPQPVVAAINGQAWGQGLELALACTFRVAAKTAHVGLPEIARGLIPGGGGTQRLSRLIGAGRAAEIIMSGRILGADEAKAIGLVEAVLPDQEFLSHAMRWIDRIATRSQPALYAAKRAIVDGVRLPLDRGLDLEGRLFVQLLSSRIVQEDLERVIVRSAGPRNDNGGELLRTA